jgi:hypothetical protein
MRTPASMAPNAVTRPLLQTSFECRYVLHFLLGITRFLSIESSPRHMRFLQSIQLADIMRADRFMIIPLASEI